MTREEAKAYIIRHCNPDYPKGKTEWEQAVNMAIKALEQQPEPCEDAVSREMVSEWLKQYGQDVLHGKYKFSLMYIWKNLMDLPSVQPDQRWIPVAKEQILQAGYEGREVRFHIGGRLFAIRELAQ